MGEWTPLDDLGVEEAVRRDVPAAFARACERTAVAFARLNAALDWDRALDTEIDIARIRALPDATGEER